MLECNIKKVYNDMLLYTDDNVRLFYRKGKIINISLKDNSKKTVLLSKSFKCKFNFFCRLFRMEPRSVVKLNNNHIIFSFDGNVFNYDIAGNKLIKEHSYKTGMRNPLYFSSRLINENDYEVLYGEYTSNINKENVSIFKRSTDGNWEKIYTFSEKTIKHIHNIIYDNNKKRYVIFTGDQDSESGIWVADSEFKQVEPLVIGMQKYRACFGFFEEDRLIYATDSPLEQNYIMSLDMNTRELEKVMDISGPCIFGTYVNGFALLSTSVEPDSNLSSLKYKFTRKFGNGIKDNYSHIYIYNGKWQDSIRLKKDFLPMGLFQFGNIVFPYNETNKIYCTLQALKKGHLSTFEISIQDSKSN